MLRPFCSVGTGEHSTPEHRLQSLTAKQTHRYSHLCGTAGTSTAPRGRRRGQQGESDPSGTIPLTNTSFAPPKCLWRPFQSCKYPLEDLIGQVKMILLLCCRGKLWRDNAKLHFLLLRGPISEAIQRVLLWEFFGLALSTVWASQQSQGVPVLGCWHFPVPSLGTRSGWWRPWTIGWLGQVGSTEPPSAPGFKEDKQLWGLEVCHCTTLELHTQGCDANYTFRESLQQARCGGLACTGCWTLLWWVSVMEQLQPDLEGSYQSLHFIYVLHATS